MSPAGATAAQEDPELLTQVVLDHSKCWELFPTPSEELNSKIEKFTARLCYALHCMRTRKLLAAKKIIIGYIMVYWLITFLSGERTEYHGE